MIQRIQSLYLIGAFVLIILCYFLPVADISTASSQLYTFNLNGFVLNQGDTLEKVESAPALFWSGIIICGILLITLFLYKKRILQIRLCVYGIVLSLGLTFLYFFVLYNIKKEMNAMVYYKITVIFPAIAGILSYMALRAIKKDEDLVKSYDRLR